MDAFSDEFILMNWFDAGEKLKKNKISLAFYGSQPGNISEMLSDVGKSIDGAVDIADIELAKKVRNRCYQNIGYGALFCNSAGTFPFRKRKYNGGGFCRRKNYCLEKRKDSSLGFSYKERFFGIS